MAVTELTAPEPDQTGTPALAPVQAIVTTAGEPNPDNVLEAMRQVQSESGLWDLADALYELIPKGEKGFKELIDKATAAGVVGKLSANTLRFYRDSAQKWPKDSRVPGVSFSAHRTAEPLGRAKAAVLLKRMAADQGAHKVTVAAVRKAIAVQQGKITKTNTPVGGSGSSSSSAPSTPATLPPQVGLDVLTDLKAGAPKLIASIVSGRVPSADLDAIYDGLNKALGHVQTLRAKAAAKNKPATPRVAAKKPVAKRPPAKSPNDNKVARPKLRDLA